MANFCGQCAHLNTNKKGYYSNEYFCNNKRTGKELTANACENFVLDPKKSNTSGRGYKPSGCYITTIICQILGLPDDNPTLNSLRRLRDEYLCFAAPEILVDYDNYGPIISERICQSKDGIILSKVAYRFYLEPCKQLIEQERYEEATRLYLAMTTYFRYKFCIEDIPEEEKVVQEPKGHGRKLKKQNEKTYYNQF